MTKYRLALGFALTLAVPAASFAGARFTGLGDLPGGIRESQACDISADGRVVVGSSQSSNGVEAFQWQAGVITALGDLPDGLFESVAWGVSADGSVIVGSGQSAAGLEAVRWQAGSPVGLGHLPGGTVSEALDVSADGSAIIGWSTSASGDQAFEYRAGVMTGLGDLPGGAFNSHAIAISAGGTVIVGRGQPNGEEEPARWGRRNPDRAGLLDHPWLPWLLPGCHTGTVLWLWGTAGLRLASKRFAGKAE